MQSISRRSSLVGTLSLAMAAGLAAGLAVLPSLSQAQAVNFPTKPVRIITPFPVGGGPDGVARLVADKLSRAWGQPVVVENRPGGNGFIAIDAFKRSPKDGHDLIQLDFVHVTAYQSLFKKLPYDAEKDFEPLSSLFKAYFFMAVATDSPYKKVGDLVADAKARPGKLNYGSWAIGTPVHLGSELFDTMAGTQMQNVIYKETTQLYTAVATNELSYALGTSATAGPLLRAGKLRFLAVAAPKRQPGFPDVPTVAEAGGPANFEVSGWNLIAAPKGLPPAVADKIKNDIDKALAEPDVREKYLSFGYEPFVQTREQLASYIQSETKRYAEIIKKANVSLD
jgi:tripartite-type tricarboxylate transporter receptor subunit TctC